MVQDDEDDQDGHENEVAQEEQLSRRNSNKSHATR